MRWFRKNTKRIDKLTKELEEAELRRERADAQDKFYADLESARETVAAEHDAKYQAIPPAMSTAECPKCLSEILDREFVEETSLSVRYVYSTVVVTSFLDGHSRADRRMQPNIVQSQSVELLRLRCVSCGHDVGWEKPADVKVVADVL
ncbi:hypothetical protein [Rhodococcus erythropolis]|uniref:hypothetical protein n=1 Tax=Rhodococcus erythropolis TaxID=1833 RepID=UPI003671F0CA